MNSVPSSGNYFSNCLVPANPSSGKTRKFLCKTQILLAFHHEINKFDYFENKLIFFFVFLPILNCFLHINKHWHFWVPDSDFLPPVQEIKVNTRLQFGPSVKAEIL